jgi:tryptophan-rich sensory protein
MTFWRDPDFWLWFALPVFISSIISGNYIRRDEYVKFQSMKKYSLPPTWVFGIWLFLYPIFAYAFYELWKLDNTTYSLFMINLVLNILAGSLYGYPGLVSILLLDAVIILTFVAQVRRTPAMYWLLPYIAWVLVATWLTNRLIQIRKLETVS